jgi:glycosyltransferase involved in cell wall biosynthesis
MMLPAPYLVPIGDTAAMAGKVSALLRDGAAWSAARLWARERAKAFHWKDIARQTSDIYMERWRQRQSSH